MLLLCSVFRRKLVCFSLSPPVYSWLLEDPEGLMSVSSHCFCCMVGCPVNQWGWILQALAKPSMLAWSIPVLLHPPAKPSIRKPSQGLAESQAELAANLFLPPFQAPARGLAVCLQPRWSLLVMAGVCLASPCLL